MDTTKSAQELGFTTGPAEEEEVVLTTTSPSAAGAAAVSIVIKAIERERKLEKLQKEPGLPCPECSSTNTKFCYYNNYSLTQPRYFCKACRRYWTEIRSRRSVPVGSNSSKNNRPTIENVNLPQIPWNNNINNGNVGAAPLSAIEQLRNAARGLGPLFPTMIPMPAPPAQPESLFPLVDDQAVADGFMQLFPLGDMSQEPHRGQGGGDHGDMKP